MFSLVLVVFESSYIKLGSALSEPDSAMFVDGLHCSSQLLATVSMANSLLFLQQDLPQLSTLSGMPFSIIVSDNVDED